MAGIREKGDRKEVRESERRGGKEESEGKRTRERLKGRARERGQKE